MNKRIDYFDIAKGISMLCIIAGHLGVDEINNFVFTFHVPIFFLISGYFMNDRLPMKEFVVKRAKQLMIPYFIAWVFIAAGAVRFIAVWLQDVPAVLFTVLNQFLSGLYGNGSGIHEIFIGEHIYISSVGAIWFLPALFVAVVLVRYFMNQKYGGVWIFLIAVLGYESSKAAWLPMSVQAGMVAASFVYLGMLARRYDIMEKKLPKEMAVGVAAVWVFCILFCGHLYLVENTFGNGIVDYAGALAGSYLVLKCSCLLEEKTRYIAKFFRFLGKHSLVLLCVHAVELKLMPWDTLLSGMMQSRIPASIIYFAAKSVFCILVTTLIVCIQRAIREKRKERKM